MYKPNGSIGDKKIQPYTSQDNYVLKKTLNDKQNSRLGEKEKSNFPHALKKNKLHSLIVRLRSDNEAIENYKASSSSSSNIVSMSSPTSPIISDEADKELQFILRKRSATEGKKTEVNKCREKEEPKNRFYVNSSVNPIETGEKYPIHNKNIEISTVKDSLGNNVINIKLPTTLPKVTSKNEQNNKHGLNRCSSEQDFFRESLQIPSIYLEKNHGIINEAKIITEKTIIELLDKRILKEVSISDSCAEISNCLRDRLKEMTKDNKKVVVTTYIATRLSNNRVDESLNVSIKCQTIFGKDECLTVAFENESYLIWVTLMMTIC